MTVTDVEPNALSLAQWSNGGPKGDGYCCGHRVYSTGPIVQAVALMSNPPRTKNRWHLTFKWQCNVRADHNGLHRETSDDEKWAPR